MSRLPVTLITGFLGAGKTSVLHHFISEHQGGHLAVLVENPSPLNLDSKAIRGLCGAMRRAHDSVYEIPNVDGARQIQAIANTLRELAQSGRHERVLIELAGTSGAAWLAREFLPDGAFAEFSEPTEIICVVDALEFFRAHRANGKIPFASFQQEQIAGATLVVLNKCDLLNDADRNAALAALRQIVGNAGIIETDYGELPPELLLRPIGSDEIRRALERTKKITAVAAPDENLASAVYRVHRPFHPQRFWDWFNGDNAGLLRVKGVIWLASRNLLVGGVSRTRWQNSCGAAGIWWAALPREEWPQQAAALMKMQEVWREPYGDRRQELVVIGDAAYLSSSMRRELDACLLTDDEFSLPPAEWGKFPDPFPAWDLEG
jgi:G3E family GTPase